MNVLILAASPSDRPHLRINREVAIIQEELDRNGFIADVRSTVTPAAFLDLLVTKRPDIVHISAHGTKEGLELENLVGRTHEVVADVLTKIFQECNVRIQCRRTH
jgi:hypothetical protein